MPKSSMLKLARTTNGPLVVVDGEYRLLPDDRPWWALTNEPALYATVSHLLDRSYGMQTAEAEKLLADGMIPFDLPTQSIFACGVTYKVSQKKRNEESGGKKPDYDFVGEPAHWPEIFEKAGEPGHCFGHNQLAGIRSDSGMGIREAWDVPEPELVLNVPSGKVVNAFTIGLDMSSRSIEGPSALLLCQAKVYRLCAGLARFLSVPKEPEAVFPIDIRMAIKEDGKLIYDSEMSSKSLRRDFHVLTGALNRIAPTETGWPHPIGLFTGTGMVPDDDTLTDSPTSDGKFTLRAGRHQVEISSKALDLELHCGVTEIVYQSAFAFTAGASSRYEEVEVVNHLQQ